MKKKRDREGEELVNSDKRTGKNGESEGRRRKEERWKENKRLACVPSDVAFNVCPTASSFDLVLVL